MSSQRFTPEFKDEAVRQIVVAAIQLRKLPNVSAFRHTACTSGIDLAGLKIISIAHSPALHPAPG